ncbi:MAG TPA: MFS transporter [Solirubrobacteraceae bacterium]|jgi:EmrB/QacA subfamily drug resistance transporter|nr:MFS transporter [Solirubrobacteraceae bacterium]
MPSATAARLPLALACGASFVALLDVTLANLAIPDLAREFEGQGVAGLSWVVTAYTVPFAALLAPAGRLADVVGRRRLFLAGALAFTAGSAVAAAAPSFGVLVAARAVQGAGAALLLPASLAFVLADTPPARRAAAIGLWSAAASLAAATGPAIGGVLVGAAGWRSLFLVTVPIGAALAAGAARATGGAGAGARVPDVAGTVLLAGGIGLAVLALTEGAEWGWASAATLAAFAIAAAALAAALARSRRHEAPAVEVALWRSRTYAAANVVSLLFGAGLLGSMFAAVLFLTALWGYTPLEAGLAMTPGALASATVGIAVGRSARRPSARALVVGGTLLMAASAALMAAEVSSHPRFVTVWLPAALLLGVGVGAVSVGVSTAAALSVGPQRFATATGLNVAARQVGGAVGVAGIAVLLHDQAGVEEFRSVYLACALAGLAVAVPASRLVLAPAQAR